jgi:23S rRNA (guanosine2251-2'-O)-methyltransferase
MLDFVYGRRPAYEALRAGRREFYRLMIVDGIQTRGQDVVGQIVSMAREAGVKVTRSSRHELDQVAPHHQGVVLESTPYPYAELEDGFAAANARGVSPLFLLLDLLQDPQNLGTLLRTAEAVGVHGVVIPKRRAVDVTPAVVSASAGAVEHLLVAQVTNLSRVIEKLKERDVWVAGLDAAPQAQVYDEVDLRGPLGLVVGSEGSGMRRLVREKCDFLLRLPMYGKIASLNAAVAGSVALYEVARQRRM